MIMYMVTAGSYSDYGVVALFSTRQKAQGFMDDYPDSDFNLIEEMSVDDPGPGYKKGKRWFSGQALRDGTIESLEYRMYLGTRNDTKAEFHVAQRWSNEPPRLFFTIEARSPEEARKIVNDRRSQMIATGEWERSLEESKQREKAYQGRGISSDGGSLETKA